MGDLQNGRRSLTSNSAPPAWAREPLCVRNALLPGSQLLQHQQPSWEKDKPQLGAWPRLVVTGGPFVIPLWTPGQVFPERGGFVHSASWHLLPGGGPSFHILELRMTPAAEPAFCFQPSALCFFLCFYCKRGKKEFKWHRRKWTEKERTPSPTQLRSHSPDIGTGTVSGGCAQKSSSNTEAIHLAV